MIIREMLKYVRLTLTQIIELIDMGYTEHAKSFCVRAISIIDDYAKEEENLEA